MKNETEIEVTRDDGEKIELSNLSGSKHNKKVRKKKKIKIKEHAEENEDIDNQINKLNGIERDKSNKNIMKPEKNHHPHRKHKNIFNDRFEVQFNKPIGKGSFGEIFLAYDSISAGKKAVVLKLESAKEKLTQLKTEKAVLEQMNGFEGFPKLYFYGTDHDKNYLAMELLGPNLSELFDYCNNNFSLQTILLIAIQVLSRIQELHTRSGYIHRDIKPENFLIGSGAKTNVVYMIDYGLSKKYRDVVDESINNNDQSDLNEHKVYLEHIPYREKRQLTGTARYASINNHLGIEQSRRDDLEAIGYMLIYFAKKSLPWQKVPGSKKNEKYNKILEKKLSTPVEILCKDLPLEFCTYMNYVKILKFNEKPDYFFLKNLFAELLFTHYVEKYYFDWNLPAPISNAHNLRYNKDITNNNDNFDIDNTNGKFVSLGLNYNDNLTSSNNRDNNNAHNNPKKNYFKGNLDIQNNKMLAMFNNFQSYEESSESDHENVINKVIRKNSINIDSDEEDESNEGSDQEEIEDSDRTDENSIFDGNEFLTIIEDNLYKKRDFIQEKDFGNKENEVKIIQFPDSSAAKRRKSSNIAPNYMSLDSNSNLLSEYGSNFIPDDAKSIKSISSNYSNNETYQLLSNQNRKRPSNTNMSNDKKNSKNLGLSYKNNFNQILEEPMEEGAISHR